MFLRKPNRLADMLVLVIRHALVSLTLYHIQSLRIAKCFSQGRAGTPISKQINTAADCWAFLWKSLGME